MKFIDEHWRKGDALALSREFFEWSFVRNGTVTMIIGIDEQAKQIYGINGYMPYTDEEYPDCSGTIWKALRCEDYPLLGIGLSNYCSEHLKYRFYTAAGLRDAAKRYAKLYNIPVVAMDHYYRINCNRASADFEIASITDFSMPTVDFKCKIEPINSIEEFAEVIPQSMLSERVFKKDYKYIQRRFFDHPIYKYSLWKCGRNREAIVVITRDEAVGDAKACKIVDCYGAISEMVLLGSFMDELISMNDYEYVDIYSYGIPSELYEDAGLVRCDFDSPNIIPNYFQPYECKNVAIYLQKPWFDNLILFRADGDQDRPCRINQGRED